MKDYAMAPVVAETVDRVAVDDLAQLLAGPIDADAGGGDRSRIDGVVVGTLVGFANDGATPLVTYRQQPGTAALPARATVDLHGIHIGKEAVLMFDEGDPHRPIIVGCLRGETTIVPAVDAGQVAVDADGTRLVVSATERIVLRCGKASVTLTKDGKIILQGTYLSNNSSGVLRLKGGSVQIN